MSEIDVWAGARVVVAGKGLKQPREWLVRADESQPQYTNLGDGSEGDASHLVLQVNQSKLGGHDDWRLPHKVELYALVDDPEMPMVTRDSYWSSSPTQTSEIGWAYRFNGEGPGTELRQTRLCVRLVRSVEGELNNAAEEEEIARWCDSEPTIVGSSFIGIVELINRVSAPFLRERPDVQIKVRRYEDDCAVEIFATLDGKRASCWTETFARERSTIAEDFLAMQRAFPEQLTTGSGGAWIDRFPVKVDHLVGTVAALLLEIGVHVGDGGDEALAALREYARREVLHRQPRCYKIRVGNRVFTYGFM